MNDIQIENKIIMMPIDDIKPYEKNPRRNDKTVELLCEVIPKVGFNVPLVIDKDNVIVKGHARYNAAKRLGLAEIPCIVTHADAEAIRADRIADNKISEFSEWINEELLHEIDMIDFDFDFSKIGLPKTNYDDVDFGFDFNFDETEGDNSEEEQISAEEKQRLYEKFLEEESKKNALKVQITTERAIQNATVKQANTPKPQKTYVKVVCEKCGNVMYLDKNVLYTGKETIRR